MVHDRYLYDRVSNQWTVDRYLDDLLERYGGIDSVLLWTGYTNIGADERNAFDLFRNLPGGLSAVRQMVARFHARGVAVLWPNFPWDQVRLASRLVCTPRPINRSCLTCASAVPPGQRFLCCSGYT